MAAETSAPANQETSHDGDPEESPCPQSRSNLRFALGRPQGRTMLQVNCSRGHASKRRIPIRCASVGRSAWEGRLRHPSQVGPQALPTSFVPIFATQCSIHRYEQRVRTLQGAGEEREEGQRGGEAGIDRVHRLLSGIFACL